MNEDLIGLKITKYDSISKCISILRKYDNRAMSVLKNRIINNEYSISCDYTDDVGLKKLMKCYMELTNSNIEVQLYELDGEPTSFELLQNLDQMYNSISSDIDSEIV